MSLKEDLTEDERSKLSVYDYPVSNRCSSVSASKGVHCNSTVNNFITPILHSKVMQNWLYHRWKKMWYTMQRYGLPKNMEEALELVRASPTQTEGFALLADATDVR